MSAGRPSWRICAWIWTKDGRVPLRPPTSAPLLSALAKKVARPRVMRPSPAFVASSAWRTRGVLRGAVRLMARMAATPGGLSSDDVRISATTKVTAGVAYLPCGMRPRRRRGCATHVAVRAFTAGQRANVFMTTHAMRVLAHDDRAQAPRGPFVSGSPVASALESSSSRLKTA